MNLTVRINGVEYRDTCVQGITFSEEYNETLDSGVLRLTHVNYIGNLKPYDDVLIYDSEYDEVAYANLPSGTTKPNGLSTFSAQLSAWRTGGNLYDGIEYSSGTYVSGTQPFYRHLLIDQFTENIINLGEQIYSYDIEMFSETKRLETVQLPNISVTQPLRVSKKVSIYTYLKRYIELYSPKYKKVDNSASRTWRYVPKYTLDEGLKTVFDDIYSPDFSLPNPNLRDVLSQLMIVADRIPYVKDDVVYAKDISARTGQVHLLDYEEGGEIKKGKKSLGEINYISATLSSDDFCDSVRRQYSGGLSQSGTCEFVEYLGFRNKYSNIMALSNLQLETTHPIYKINKMYMCYYKRGTFKNTTLGTSTTDYVLCKQDITKLVKLDTEWNLLSQDWDVLDKEPPSTINDLAQYKLTTVSYSQQGTTIGGWGTQYTEPIEGILDVYDTQRTYIENLFKYIDRLCPYGIYSEDYYLQQKNNPSYSKFIPEVALDTNITGHLYMPSGLDSMALKLKGFFFQIEYTGFYSGALIHSRDLGRDNIVNNDNSSASLALLEKDGLNQKEKLNRFANKNYLMKGRITSLKDLIPLGNYAVINEEDDDVIIYKREYSIYNNEIKVSYAGMQDFVLKNYFTSVYSKYRTYQLMSYGESVSRAENRKAIFSLSKKNKYFDESTFFTLPTKLLFSCFKESTHKTSEAEAPHTDNINSGFIQTVASNRYILDEHTFTSGNSLCFNISMSDNISGGNYIRQWSSDYNLLIFHNEEDPDYVVGTIQDWYDIVDDDETGAIKKLGFYMGHNSEAARAITSAPTLSVFYKYLEGLPGIFRKGIFTMSFRTVNNSKTRARVNYIDALTYPAVQNVQIGHINIVEENVQGDKLSMCWNYGDGGTVVTNWKIPGTIPNNNDGSTFSYLTYLGNGGPEKFISANVDIISNGVVRNNKPNFFNIWNVKFELEKNEQIQNVRFYGLPLNTTSSAPELTNQDIITALTGYGVSVAYYPGTVVCDLNYGKIWTWNSDAERWEKEGTNVRLYAYVDLDTMYTNYPQGYEDPLANITTILPEDTFVALERGAEEMYSEKTNIFGVMENFYKDNKECIDMTLQLEPISEQYNDIVVGEWLVRLSDLSSKYNKVKASYSVALTEPIDKHKMTPFIDAFEPDSLILGFSRETVYQDQIVDIFTLLQQSGAKANFTVFTTENDILLQNTSYHFDYNATNFEVTGANQITMHGDGTYIKTVGGYPTKTQVFGDLVFTTTKPTATEGWPVEYPDGYMWCKVEESGSGALGKGIGLSIKNHASAQVSAFPEGDPYVYFDDERTMTINKNMFMLYEANKFIDKTIVYTEHKYYQQGSPEYADSFTYKLASNVLSNVSPDSIFEIVENQSTNKSYIKVNLASVGISTPGSVQYWYLDDSTGYSTTSGEYVYSYVPRLLAYHFVFGINVSADDIANGYVNIYINELTNRDNRIFDNNMQVAGTVHNCAGETGEPMSTKYDTYPIDLTSTEFRYILSISNGSGETLTVKRIYDARTKTKYATSEAPVLTNGNYIYYGDILYYTITNNALVAGYVNKTPVTGAISISAVPANI